MVVTLPKTITKPLLMSQAPPKWLSPFQNNHQTSPYVSIPFQMAVTLPKTITKPLQMSQAPHKWLSSFQKKQSPKVSCCLKPPINGCHPSQKNHQTSHAVSSPLEMAVTLPKTITKPLLMSQAPSKWLSPFPKQTSGPLLRAPSPLQLLLSRILQLRALGGHTTHVKTMWPIFFFNYHFCFLLSKAFLLASQ